MAIKFDEYLNTIKLNLRFIGIYFIIKEHLWKLKLLLPILSDL
jgi:hypothetical protein